MGPCPAPCRTDFALVELRGNGVVAGRPVSSSGPAKTRPPRLCASIGDGVAPAQQSESFDVVGRARI
jgi:hypothetical protein